MSCVVLLVALFFHACAAARAIEIPEVAVCISGAVRSFATVPVLRGFKRLVLQNPAYSAAAFAALSYDTTSPQPLEYNASLAKQLSLSISVRRALGHLRPELQAVTFYNTSSAHERFRSCRPADLRSPSTDIPALYGMQARAASAAAPRAHPTLIASRLPCAQLCFSLVRQHEIARCAANARCARTSSDEKFDFILRVRPDHLFMRPLPVALGLNVSSWPLTRLVTFGGDAASFALVPSGPLAAVYFRSFTAASSCLFREKLGDERLPNAFAPSMQCASLELWENFARCVVTSNLLYHGLPKLVDTPHRPALIARLCNLNATSRAPAWPMWPMPPGETCVTSLDALKRPRIIATYRPGSHSSKAATSGGLGSWEATLLLVGCVVIFAMYNARERLREDATALGGMLAVLGASALEQAQTLLGPERVGALRMLKQRLVEAVGGQAAAPAAPVYVSAALDDDDDA